MDGGDFIARQDRVPEKSSIQLKIAAEFMLEAMDWLGYSAGNIGEGDLVFGDGFLRERAEQLRFPLVSASVLTGGAAVFPETTVVSVGGIQVGIVGVVSDGFGEYVEEHSDPGSPLEVRETASAMRRGLELIEGEADLKVLLAHVPYPELPGLLADVPGYDIVISGHDTDSIWIDQPEWIHGAHVVQIGWDGKRVGRLDLEIDEQGTLVEVTGTSTAMDSRWPDHPQMTDLHQRYLDRVADAIDAILQDYPVGPPPTGGHYVGSSECRTCHPDQHAHWVATEHAWAWKTLTDRHRDFDPECFPCHTTGFQYEGGFRPTTATAHMVTVQCESCHGAGADHAASPTLPYTRPGESTCTGCHVPLHSPDFDFETYFPRVRHPVPARLGAVR